MLSILKRPPHDNFTFRLFFKLVSQLTISNDSIYIWSAALDPSYFNTGNRHLIGGFLRDETELYFRNRLFDLIQEDLIILGIKDHLTSDNFDPSVEDKPSMVQYLEDLFNFYPDKKFILFTSLENLSVYLTNSNLTIIPWGGDLTNQQQSYKHLVPVLDKNFDSTYSYISLNRNIRIHRAAALSILYGLHLESTGLISCMFNNKLPDVRWKVNNTIKELLSAGQAKMIDAKFTIQDDPKIYANYDNDNTSNFKIKLSTYYQNTFVEIISETSFTEQAYLLTEKTLNSIYGCNFPILLCGPGSVKFLRDMGLDMFDDVIDHSYDAIVDPAERLYHAIYDNREILSNVHCAKTLWQTHKQRFVNNVDFVKEQIYKFYETRAEQKFSKALA